MKPDLILLEFEPRAVKDSFGRSLNLWSDLTAHTPSGLYLRSLSQQLGYCNVMLQSNTKATAISRFCGICFFQLIIKLSNFDEFVECLDSLVQEGYRLSPCLVKDLFTQLRFSQKGFITVQGNAWIYPVFHFSLNTLSGLLDPSSNKF